MHTFYVTFFSFIKTISCLYFLIYFNGILFVSALLGFYNTFFSLAELAIF